MTLDMDRKNTDVLCVCKRDDMDIGRRVKMDMERVTM